MKNARGPISNRSLSMQCDAYPIVGGQLSINGTNCFSNIVISYVHGSLRPADEGRLPPFGPSLLDLPSTSEYVDPFRRIDDIRIPPLALASNTSQHLPLHHHLPNVLPRNNFLSVSKSWMPDPKRATKLCVFGSFSGGHCTSGPQCSYHHSQNTRSDHEGIFLLERGIQEPMEPS